MTSYLGACLSIMISIVTLFYAQSRFGTMLKYGDTIYQSVQEPGVITNQVFQQKDTNFNMAFGIHRHNSMHSDNYLIDYTGYLEVSLNRVDATVGDAYPTSTPLQIRNCSKDDL